MKKNLQIFQGSSFEWLILVKDINGSPLDMAGFTSGTSGVRGMIKTRPEDEDPVLSFHFEILNASGINMAISDGRCHLNSSQIASLQNDLVGSPYILCTLTAIETSSLTPGKIFYDIEIEDLTGFVFKPFYGAITVLREITK